MFTLSRHTVRLAVVASFAALAAACSPDSTAPSIPTLSAHNRDGGGGGGGGGGASSGFSVLGQEAVSCSGGSIIGNVGTFRSTPPGAVTLVGCPVTGAVDIGGPAAVAAYEAFLTQYDALAPTVGECPLDHTLLSTLPADTTLSPGVYCTGAALTASTVTLTLDAAGDPNAVWIFKIGTPGASGTGALTGTDFAVVLANGAQACNVTWWVSQAVTMTRAAFQGNILAGAAISMSAGTLAGNAWAGAKLPANLIRVGDVTFTEGTTVVGCGAAGGTPSCKVFGDRVTGGGWINGPSGGKATFAVTGGFRHGGFQGELEYDAKGSKGRSDDVNVKGTGVTAYSVLGGVARRIEGTARLNGKRGFTYRVDVSDNGEPGRNDTFAISLWNASGALVSSASGTLRGGNIQLHKAHGSRCHRDGHDDDGDEEDDGHGNGNGGHEDDNGHGGHEYDHEGH